MLEPFMLTKEYLRETVAAKALKAVENMNSPIMVTDSTQVQLVLTLIYSTKGDDAVSAEFKTLENYRKENESLKETVYYLRRELRELQS